MGAAQAVSSASPKIVAARCHPIFKRTFLPSALPAEGLTPSATGRLHFMGLILLEALGALAVLLLIVWWTMFSGRAAKLPSEFSSGRTAAPTLDGAESPSPRPEDER